MMDVKLKYSGALEAMRFGKLDNTSQDVAIRV